MCAALVLPKSDAVSGSGLGTMNYSPASGRGGAQGPGEQRMLGAQGRGKKLFHRFPGGSRGHLKHLWLQRSSAHPAKLLSQRTECLSGHVTMGEVAQYSEGAASF